METCFPHRSRATQIIGGNGIPLTKRRLRGIRRIWRHYKNGKDWKKLIDELDQFLAQKGLQQREPIEPFDPERLKLVAIDFIS